MNQKTGLTEKYVVQTSRRLGQLEYAPVLWFHQPAFLERQPCGDPWVFELRNQRTGQSEAMLFLYEKNGAAESPCRATFGSVEFRPKVPHAALELLIRTASNFAAGQGAGSIGIVSYPFCYHPEASARLTAAFTGNGFSVAVTDLNYHIPVTEDPLESRMHLSERRRLRKCKTADMQFSAEATPDIAQLYEFITRCRQRRGIPVTLDFAGFGDMFAHFPDHYQAFTVRHGNQLAATAIGVRISPAILYYFFPADDEAYKTFSPTVLLLHGMYGFARQAGYTLLDLGIATDRGVPNYGLIRFKENMGAQPSLKLTFRKTLHS